MSAIVVDTHAVIWYLSAPARLSRHAVAAFDATIHSGSAIYVPSITVVEVTYLVERGRLRQRVYDVLVEALTDGNSGFVLAPLSLGAAETVQNVPRTIVPDMPDRIIAATALYPGLPLVTRDARIRACGVPTLW
ncbi:MAG TPA: type II toxin-antitoxin system VapC family toxin [Roseiflexaceae bacterium]|nr:type II toxin-antitoxin system VapC family toxin [Roseiflexaceae bacterium]